MKHIHTILLLSILIILSTVSACNTKSDSVKASPGYPGEQREFGNIELQYIDTTLPEYKSMIVSLDSFYKRQVAAGFNGSVLVGYEGKILYERYFGYANKSDNRKLTPNAGVQLASTSKTFTATAIMYLHQNKYLNINDPVQKYLPTFPYEGITVKMLLNHRSGLNNYLYWYGNYRKDQRTPITNKQLLNMIGRYKPGLSYTPDTRFKYSNTNYTLLADIIEAVTEMSYPDFMKHYFFEPLGMKNTFVYNHETGLPDNATISYKAGWQPFPYMFADGVYGDKNIYSTVRDMYKWDQSFYEYRYLDSNTLNLAYGPCSFERAGIKNYGLGWRMFCYENGEKIVFHNGWWHGNNTLFIRFLRDKQSLIVLGNKHNNNIYHQGPVVYSIINNTPVSKNYYTYAGQADKPGDDDSED